jgi:hypothetical protein
MQNLGYSASEYAAYSTLTPRSKYSESSHFRETGMTFIRLNLGLYSAV